MGYRETIFSFADTKHKQLQSLSCLTAPAPLFVAMEPLNSVYLCEYNVYFPICRAGGLLPPPFYSDSRGRLSLQLEKRAFINSLTQKALRGATQRRSRIDSPVGCQ